VAYTVKLFETDAGSDVIGSKAASLVELHRAGFLVPQAVCVTTEAYRAWRQAGGLTGDLRDSLLHAYRSLRPPVAVRSSSPAEDLANASFAGQYATILGVQTEGHVLEAVQECWASATSAASTAYRRTAAIDLPVEMAVLIQELVPADVAGVMFTINPVTDRADQIVINSNFGLGDSVVSGRAEPDTFVLDKASGAQLELRVGTKRVTTQRAATGVSEVALDSARQEAQSLNGKQLDLLARAARQLEASYDAPMDSEWAFVGDTLHMLQARPVTTGLAAYHAYLLDEWARDRRLTDDPRAEWVRGSVLSGLRISPLYYSEMAPFFADMFVRIAALHGAPAIRQKVFTYFRGYTYTDAAFSSAADPAGEVAPESPLGAAWRSNLKIALRHPLSLAFWSNIDYYNRRWRQVWSPAIEAQRPDLATASIEAIRSFIEFLEVQRRERSVVAGLAVGYAPNFLGLLAWCLCRWLPNAPKDTLGVLTSGLPDSLTHQENVGLWNLAQAAAARPPVASQLVAERFDDLQLTDGGCEFLEELADFRRRHADRGSSDRDIFQPRWGDDQGLVLRQVVMLLKLGRNSDPAAAHARAEANRIRREKQLLGELGRGPVAAWRRWVLLRVIRTTQRYVMHRDNQRHTFEPYFYSLRQAYRAIGERLAGRGLLDRGDDVFFLAKHEIYAHADGKLASARLTARARWRKTWWHLVSREEPPTHLLGYRPHDPVKAPAGTADLVGAPGAPGVATGLVRLINSLHELNRIQPGDVVVTYAIDPAWTPVFGIIAGAISVEGGMLAHAAVLGREYGLPVVLGLRDATTRLKEGMRVRIDGTSGSVVILEDIKREQ
jgi:pyruvate,water dikinase